MVDLEAKRAEGKGMGYDRWAAKHNLKQMRLPLLLPAVRLFFPGEIGRSLFRSLYRHAESITELKNVEKRLNGKRGCNGRCLPIPRPAPSGTGYDENKPRRQDIEIYYSFVGKVDLPE